ncbi:hypothetical protein CEP51_001076 [Fusarium floridanum]|uniref:DUF676 domain-containing protein n=1 Tax=Fusarium floridanum TaxID=1325733 RepID=A0A428SJ05_9HYPO|nr:hypothetical protein CEP51_001076 [Fusarium floridanum]
MEKPNLVRDQVSLEEISMEKPRKLGLNQVHPDPTDIEETSKKRVIVVAIHGMDTQSPKTWIAYEKDGDPESGEVNWLKDKNMLPSVLPDCRILTYDWNANIDKGAATQSLRGHATTLLDKLHIDRDESGKSLPILFIASCFGGLLLAEALLLASDPFQNYQDIYHSTIGAIFLGTPFRGTHDGFFTAAELRVAVAIASGAETAKGLVAFLKSEPDERRYLDQLVERFYDMINNKKLGIPVVFFYETRETDFTKVIKKLPSKFVKTLDGKKRGILVPKNSACLWGHEHHELSVRHTMLCKFSGPEDVSFKTVCYSLKRLLVEGEKRRQERAFNGLRQQLAAVFRGNFKIAITAGLGFDPQG